MTCATGRAQLNSGGEHVGKPRQFRPGHFDIHAVGGHSNRQKPEEDSVQFALTLIQGKWKIGILSHLQHGPARLSEVRKALPGASKKMVVQHLREMERDGLVTRTDMSGKLPHVEYSLTNPLGLAAVGLLSILAQWATDYRSSELSQDDLPNLVDTKIGGRAS